MSPANGDLDPRLPVVVGVGQLNIRVDQGEDPAEPVDMVARAARLASVDSGATHPDRLLAELDTIAILDIFSFHYRDPARLVADRLGAEPRRRWYTVPGGNFPQTLLNRAALDISEGAADAVLIGGAEAWRTRTSARTAGIDLGWTKQDEAASPTDTFGGDSPPLWHDDEVALGLVAPVQLYPIFESAIRAAAGRTQHEHRAVIAELWSRFSDVAADNPHAWIRERLTPEDIGTPGPTNRMIGHPYPKLMNSNNSVEQSAAVLLCSVERARAAGIPSDRWVFPWAGTDAADTWVVGHRTSLHRSPAIRIAGGQVLELAGVGVDDLAHADLYSCFPSAVEVAADELGLDSQRPLTVTGGLSFAGGPWNNYVTHSIATMAEVLRDDAGSIGLVTANGGYLTKHAFGVYSTTPPPHARFVHRDCQTDVDAVGSVDLASDWVGPVTIEGATVMHDRDGKPEKAFVATRTPDDRRAWAVSNDVAVMAVITEEEPVGLAAHRAKGAILTLV